MYAYLRGEIAAIHWKDKGEPVEVWLEAGGIGFRIHGARTTAARLSVGQEATLYISQSAALYGGETTLYGFTCDEDRRLFELLWSMPGTGAKKALDHYDKVQEKSPLRFLQAIGREDAKFLAAFFGFTSKTVSKMLAQLKEKAEALLPQFSLSGPRLPEAGKPAGEGLAAGASDDGDLWQKACQALAALGFDARQASGVINSIMSRPSETPRTLEVLVKEAIRELSLRQTA